MERGGGGRRAGAGEAFDPPGVAAERRVGTAGDALGEQEPFDGLAKGVSIGFLA
jgi:hypothetical protein